MPGRATSKKPSKADQNLKTIQVKLTLEQFEKFSLFVDSLGDKIKGSTLSEKRGYALSMAALHLPGEVVGLRSTLKQRVDEKEVLEGDVARLKKDLESMETEAKKQARIAGHLSELFVYATGGTPGF